MADGRWLVADGCHLLSAIGLLGMMAKTLVLGLGNPILTDDGVGIHVVRQLEVRGGAQLDGVALAEASVGGFRLLELLAGHERAIIVDAMQSRGGRPGAVLRLGVDGVCASLHSGCTHDLTLPGALALGRRLGMSLPADEAITIVAVEAEDVLTFGEACTPAVQAAIPCVVEQVLAELQAGTIHEEHEGH